MCVKMGFVLEMARFGTLRHGLLPYVLQIMPGQDYVRLYQTPVPRRASLCHSRTHILISCTIGFCEPICRYFARDFAQIAAVINDPLRCPPVTIHTSS